MSYKLFEVFGVELEYMIVDKTTFKVKPIADLVFKECTGSFTSDYENGTVAWSNELVSHVIEIKTNGPVKEMGPMAEAFHSNVTAINKLLEKHNAILMPGGAHPTVDPLTETKIWPHEYNEIYALYDRVFNCKGHGWSNLQSTHINLPFQGDGEFRKLHAAIRAILPFIPALTASTPILDGALSGFKDTRLEYYRKNQQKIPIIAGKVIPEPVYSKEAYHQKIFNPIKDAIRPFDSEGILDHHFLNSRGAIARFDRGAIEIRIIDNQEAPKVDIAILCLIVAVLKDLCQQSEAEISKLALLDTDLLAQQLLAAIKDAEKAKTTYPDLTKHLGIDEKVENLGEVWKQLLNRYKTSLTADQFNTLSYIVENGSLASRMESRFNANPNAQGIAEINKEMIRCLQHNALFTK
ncbi:glutamate-cysteine ligase family protein [Luteibaculum oceani]|uniref:Glutamate--cysteine ligase n=1 Tax=Luteibaculum oceani TaxID=1294296 RepID=A0A5C6VIF4_9FLAO|nr:glutamate-cysteine ligase family protein [Luteibaculum oceani]TXC85143.1 glutamate--cysteine ligase [Luteibaculum oceani]